MSEKPGAESAEALNDADSVTLDIYWPPIKPTSSIGKTAILFYVYGRGFGTVSLPEIATAFHPLISYLAALALSLSTTGTKKNAREQSPLALLLNWFATKPKESLLKVLLVEAQYEPEWISDMSVDYQRLWNGLRVKLCRWLLLKDITGEGEEWGVETVEWMWKNLKVGVVRTVLTLMTQVYQLRE
ncbi:hypothetical protein AGABI2DRAFT_144978 [Agaricus bisporus var. bisporus H97]|uniref:hypothetical protein n=1 Tax=Agaricus bisporus var. bisporus (strain H97 / ATCC MYA-4626 / FGSC 10389) TaxID=936046 RepID=UPI00029F7F21|nr:hypothetical protein AGABI2DRAFT_144978 [Agaricus bisporus var. bisporus H97]EKV44423.1 hypothetical protein AGABI2DRAFT_144978 [Agaricus bisporus var. bisporus H97]